jgi:HEAT repeat protein
MVALAKIGKDPSILPLFKKLLPENDQEVRETAALAMGISALPEAIDDLLHLSRDDEDGRKLVDKTGVDFRTRSFACYGLGLIAYATTDLAIKNKILDAMKALLDAQDDRRDVQVAALNTIRLLRPDMATLVGRSDEKGDTKKRVLDILEGKQYKQWMHQSAILALGQMAVPEDTKACEAIQDYGSKGRDEQAKYFTCIALGQIGGEKNRDYLRSRLTQGRTQDIQKPWIALGLAIMDYMAREADKSREIDATSGEILAQFEDMKSPLPSAGLGIALGIMRDKDAGDRLHERMNRVKNDDEAAGYLAVALGLMNYQEAKEDINAMLDKATRRDKLLTQCAIGLGLLGDKEVSLKLTARLKEQNPVAVFSALAQGLGFIGDRRSISGLVELLSKKDLQPLNRAFAAVALGLVCDKEDLPWNSKISVNINYAAPLRFHGVPRPSSARGAEFDVGPSLRAGSEPASVVPRTIERTTNALEDSDPAHGTRRHAAAGPCRGRSARRTVPWPRGHRAARRQWRPQRQERWWPRPDDSWPGRPQLADPGWLDWPNEWPQDGARRRRWRSLDRAARHRRRSRPLALAVLVGVQQGPVPAAQAAAPPSRAVHRRRRLHQGPRLHPRRALGDAAAVRDRHQGHGHPGAEGRTGRCQQQP